MHKACLPVVRLRSSDCDRQISIVRSRRILSSRQGHREFGCRPSLIVALHLVSLSRMNIVITGGTGLIGSAITRDLINRGHSAILLSRSAKKSGDDRIRIVQWDAENHGPWVESISNSDAILNLTGESIGGGD